jgi:hypothetical protein
MACRNILPRAGRRRSLPDGNPPSGVASGYVWFDVMALLVAPYLVALVRARPMIVAPSRSL